MNQSDLEIIAAATLLVLPPSGIISAFSDSLCLSKELYDKDLELWNSGLNKIKLKGLYAPSKISSLADGFRYTLSDRINFYINLYTSK